MNDTSTTTSFRFSDDFRELLAAIKERTGSTRGQIIEDCVRECYGDGITDKIRLDWLADPDNQIGQVMLPTKAVIENLHSLRAAIDAAMWYEHE